jgi:hypothetical protein
MPRWWAAGGRTNQLSIHAFITFRLMSSRAIPFADLTNADGSSGPRNGRGKAPGLGAGECARSDAGPGAVLE